MNLVNFDFKGANVRTVTDENGEVLFVGKDVCGVLGYTNHSKAISDNCRGLTASYPILDSLGRTQTVRVLTEGDVLRLVVKSNLPAAVEFERWVFEEVLPSIRKTGGYQIASVEPQSQAERKISEEMAFLDGACRILRLPESGKVAMLAAYAEQKGFPSLALPGYAIDSGIVTAGSSMPTKALTELLKDHHVDTSAKKFNLLLESVGVIERLPRKNSVGGITEFWSITDAGLKYGKNLTSPRNQRETQPHWYIHTFPQLLELVSA